jgi:Fungal chitosanase of glycosyl hydrolase group 75
MWARTTSVLCAATILFCNVAIADEVKALTGVLISEPYRLQFRQCDTTNKFGAVQFPIVSKRTGKTLWYGCKSDPSNFTRFEKISATMTSPLAVIVASKLGHDEDGSSKACSSSRGITDQCGTSLKLNSTPTIKCVLPSRGRKSCVPLNADLIPYVVIPLAAPVGIEARAFSNLSGVSIGDYGVVIANGRTIPVVVGDGGPAYKIGEGSTALLRRLSGDGRVRTFDLGVVFVLFPGTHDDVGTLSPDTFVDRIQKRGSELYAALAGKP